MLEREGLDLGRLDVAALLRPVEQQAGRLSFEQLVQLALGQFLLFGLRGCGCVDLSHCMAILLAWIGGMEPPSPRSCRTSWRHLLFRWCGPYGLAYARASDLLLPVILEDEPRGKRFVQDFLRFAVRRFVV